MKERTSKYGLKGLLTGLALASLFGSTMGCSPTNQLQSSRERNQEVLAERNNDYLENKIREISIYQRFNDGRYGVSYETLTDITGIPRELGSEANELSVWVEVGSQYDQIGQEVVKTSEGDAGIVRLDVPYEKAQEIYSALSQYRDKELGIERLPSDFWKDIPSGGY